jgi:hypothetical protein
MTLRKGRKGWPTPAQVTLPNNAERGLYHIYQHRDLPQHKVTVWKDNKPVIIASNFEFFIGTCLRSKKAGGYSKIAVDCPANIGAYNATMGAVDRYDQEARYMRIHLISNRNMRGYQLACITQG